MVNKKIKNGILVLVFLSGITLLSYKMTLKISENNVRSATTSSVALFTLQPGSLTIPPNGTTKINVSIGTERAGFIHTELTFDNTKVRLAQDISIAESPLTRVIKVTSASEANSTGKINIILALEPAKVSNSPTGSFNIATLVWAPNTTTSNVTTSVNFVTSKIRGFNMDAASFTLNSQNLSLTVNPASPAPSPTSPPPTPSPTSPPPSPTPSPVTDTTPPSLKIDSPLNGAIISRKDMVPIMTSASDETGGSGMSKVEFYINGSLKYADTSYPYSYSWKSPAKPGAYYVINVRAYDKAGNSSSQSVNIKAQ